MKDACYQKAMASYGKWSARAAQATAKCRKKAGRVRKTQAGANLKRWAAEKWKDKRTGEPCGHPGPGKEYCRPTKKISSRTPNTRPSSKMLKLNINRKKAGLKARNV
jgi:hypothetical protein